MKKILLGANYYPEDWDENLIDFDIENMKKCHFNVVRIAEFAWKKMELSENEYSFDWLHKVVDKMHEAGIGVILGTPTATPPSWLYKKYPDIAMLSPTGVRTSHGGRRHCCSSNPIYREYSRKIVERMAEEFGSDPGVIGWQIDNEIYHWEPGCCCSYCMDNFHAWLRDKYGSVEAINSAWNLNLFSQAYDEIEDIPAPFNTWHNPHIKLEWNLSQSNNHKSFVHMQAEIIKAHSAAPVGTDTMPVNGFDYRELNAPLDVAQFNHYDTDLSRPAMWMDYMRSFSKIPFWNTETQACWNGSTSPGHSLMGEGFVYMNTWLPVMLGGGGNLYWLWRTHWAGHELMHGAVMDTSGRFTYANGEIVKAAREFEQLEDILCATKVKSDTALMFSSLNWNIHKSQQISTAIPDDTGFLNEFYQKLLGAGIHPSVIDGREPLDDYKLLVTPSAYSLEEGNLKERITRFVENGGVWVVGPLSDIRTSIGTKYKNSPYGFLEELTGAHLSYIIPHDDGRITLANEQGEELKGRGIFELFDDGDFEPLLSVADGHSALVGKHASFVKKVGQGYVIFLGTLPEDRELERIFSKASELACAESYKVSDGAMITKREGDGRTLYIAAALKGKACEWQTDGSWRNLVSGELVSGSISLAPYEVAVLERADAERIE